MKEVMEEMYGSELPFPDENPMVVISNTDKLNGAAAINEKDILDQAIKKIHSGKIFF